MSKPNINIPAEFAVNGVKTPFSNAKIQDGFDRINPDVFAGDNLNQFIDDTYKGLNGVLELYEGCVLYDSTVTYTNKSLVFDITNDGIKFYHSLQNGNINHALTDADYWEEVNLGGSSRNVGEIVSSTLPLTDAGLHLLDGTLLPYGVYKEFIDYIADLYAENPSANYFCTESDWQSSVSTYGVCGKFVYDSTNNTVRLPKYSNKIYTKSISSTAPVVGNGMAVGVTNGSVYAGLANTTGDYARLSPNSAGYGALLGTQSTSSNNLGINYVGITTDSTKSGIIADLANITTSLDGYYYIVIATSTKTDIEVDIDEVTTDLNNKVDLDGTNATFPHIVEAYVNGTSWYRVYSDGWCEQGGIDTTGSGPKKITFLKAYNAINYTVLAASESSTSTGTATTFFDRTTTSFGVYKSNTRCCWEAKGYIS